MNILSIIVASISLIISYMALHLTIIKPGKLVAFLHSKVLTIDKGSKIPQFVCLSMVIGIKNKGANPVCVEGIQWSIKPKETDYSKLEIKTYLDINNIHNFKVFRPYETTIGELSIYIKTKDGNKDRNIIIAELEKKEFHIVCTGVIYDNNKSRKYVKNFNITKEIKRICEESKK